jgi:plasmid stability protein
MAQLTVRGIDEELVRKLKLRAAQNGRSAEAEHREILKRALENGACEDPWAELRRFQDGMRKKYGTLPDSSEDIRHMRDERTEYLAEPHDAAKPRRR